MRYGFQSQRRPQFRRCVFVNSDLYNRIRAYAEAHHVSMSSLIERVLAPILCTDTKEIK